MRDKHHARHNTCKYSGECHGRDSHVNVSAQNGRFMSKACGLRICGICILSPRQIMAIRYLGFIPSPPTLSELLQWLPCSGNAPISSKEIKLHCFWRNALCPYKCEAPCERKIWHMLYPVNRSTWPTTGVWHVQRFHVPDPACVDL